MSWYHEPGSPEGNAAPPQESQPPPPAPLPQPATGDGSRLPPAEFWIVPTAVLLLVAGAIAPWLTVEMSGFGEPETTNVGGIRGSAPGLLALLSGLAASGLLCFWLVERVMLLPVVATIVSSVAVLVAIYHAADPATGTDVSDAVQVGVGWGVWVTLAASLALVAASVALALRTRTTYASPSGSAS